MQCCQMHFPFALPVVDLCISDKHKGMWQWRRHYFQEPCNTTLRNTGPCSLEVEADLKSLKILRVSQPGVLHSFCPFKGLALYYRGVSQP